MYQTHNGCWPDQYVLTHDTPGHTSVSKTKEKRNAQWGRRKVEKKRSKRGRRPWSKRREKGRRWWKRKNEGKKAVEEKEEEERA